jgi:hypothetical protein
MLEPEQSVGWQVEPDPSEQMQDFETDVSPNGISTASRAAVFCMPVVSPAEVEFWQP